MAAAEDEYFEVALAAVKEMVSNAFKQPRDYKCVNTKTSTVDLVTETDQAVEKLLVQRLSARFPDHKFIGEESVSDGGKLEWTDAPTWIIDPIDGTTNFVHRLPFIGICVGLTIKKELRAGIVYNPANNDLWCAQKGKGAYKNGFPIHVSGTKDANSALCISTIGSQRQPENIERYVHNFKALMVDLKVRGHRSLGAAAINMCYIAEGGSDLYVEYGLHCWDMAASGLIILEAGGAIIDPSGGEFNIMSRRILCGSSKELLTSIAPHLKNVEFPHEG